MQFLPLLDPLHNQFNFGYFGYINTAISKKPANKKLQAFAFHYMPLVPLID